jgi:transcriptional regulator with XRE-family HTH domain
VVTVDVGKNIKRLREERDWTQIELSQKVGINNSVLSRIESGKRDVEDYLLVKFAEVFNVSTDYLLGLTNESNRTGTNTIHEKFNEALKDSPDLLDFWKEISRREDLQLLFKQARELKPQTIKKVVEVIKLIEDEEAEQ